GGVVRRRGGGGLRGGRCRGGGGRLGLGGLRLCRRVHVVAGDDAVRAGRHDRGQVDAEVLRQLAHGRLGQGALPPVDRSGGGRRRRCRFRRGGGRRGVAVQLRLGAGRRLARAAAGGGGGHAVADQHGLAARALRLRLRLGLGRGVRRGRRRLLGRGRAAGDVHRDDGRAHVDRGALREVQGADHAVVGDGQFDGRLRRL